MAAGSASRNRLLQGLVRHWPVWLTFAFFALLPMRRQMEIPLSLLAIGGIVLAASKARRPEVRSACRFILPLFLFFWIPMLASCFDSMDASKSWGQTMASLRYPLAAIAVAVWLKAWSSRELLLRAMTWMLLFWAADAFVQLALGHDVFGVPLHEDRLNALFYSRYQYFGPTLAFLSPLAIDYMRRNWAAPAWITGFALIFGAVMISGMRAAWLMMLVITGVFVIVALRNSKQRWLGLVLPVSAVAMIAVAMLASPLFKERIEDSAQAGLGSQQALDEALSYRLPLFTHALEMYRDHPVNGVGVRAFRAAYPNYAADDDPHMPATAGEMRAHQAHNIVLEFMSDTGTIGLVGLLLSYGFCLWWWRRLGPGLRGEALPYALALATIIFPLNSWFSAFGVFTMSNMWMIVGLCAAVGWPDDRKASAVETEPAG